MYQCKEEFGIKGYGTTITLKINLIEIRRAFCISSSYLAFLAMFIGMPLFILIAVAVSTTLIANTDSVDFRIAVIIFIKF